MPDDRRERDKYRRASLREQWGDELRAFLGSTPLVVLVAVLVGGWLVLQFTRPQIIRVSEVRPGDCLYIRAADADVDPGGGRAIGTEGQVLLALFEQSAERAPCDASHSHEVADAWQLDAPAGAAYPGAATIVAEQQARCEAAFEAHVGHPVKASTLALTTGVPTERAWNAGIRSVVCLVSNADGSFLAGSARGSRR
jgi:hypothetical protein